MGVTLARLKAVLRYAPDDGSWVWLVATSPKIKPGDPAGSVMGNGYWRVGLDGKDYLAHRLAWFYMTGSWPKLFVDHANGDHTDNRWANLREADHVLNQANRKRSTNNTTGFKGVTRRQDAYYAQIGDLWIGPFDQPELAHRAYMKQAIEKWGEFARAE